MFSFPFTPWHSPQGSTSGSMELRGQDTKLNLDLVNIGCLPVEKLSSEAANINICCRNILTRLVFENRSPLIKLWTKIDLRGLHMVLNQTSLVGTGTPPVVIPKAEIPDGPLTL